MTSEAAIRTSGHAGDPQELEEWSESFDQLLASGGTERAEAVLRRLGQEAADAGLNGYESVTTDYVNTIPVAQEPPFPGDEDVERSYRRLLRWNAAVLVQRARRPGVGVGGHISTYAGAATHYEVGLLRQVTGHQGAGRNFEARNATHQMMKLTVADLKAFRDLLQTPVTDTQIDADPYAVPYYRPAADSPEITYLLKRRRELGGLVPQRATGPPRWRCRRPRCSTRPGRGPASSSQPRRWRSCGCCAT